MDWQIISAILSALAAVLTIAELVYRHVQNKKAHGNYYLRQNKQNNARVTTRLYKKVRGVQWNVRIVQSIERLYKKLQRGAYNPHRVDCMQQIKKVRHA